MRRKDGLIAMDLRCLHEELLFACMPYSNKNRELYFIAFHTDDIDSTEVLYCSSSPLKM